MIVGRITSKSQTTVPLAVRRALGVKPGDSIGYEIDGDRVTMVRAQEEEPDMFVGNFSTFTEWDTDADRKAYAKL